MGGHPNSKTKTSLSSEKPWSGSNNPELTAAAASAAGIRDELRDVAEFEI